MCERERSISDGHARSNDEAKSERILSGRQNKGTGYRILIVEGGGQGGTGKGRGDGEVRGAGDGKGDRGAGDGKGDRDLSADDDGAIS